MQKISEKEIVHQKLKESADFALVVYLFIALVSPEISLCVRSMDSPTLRPPLACKKIRRND